MLNVFLPSPPEPTMSRGLKGDRSTGTLVSMRACRKPISSSAVTPRNCSIDSKAAICAWGYDSFVIFINMSFVSWEDSFS